MNSEHHHSDTAKYMAAPSCCSSLLVHLAHVTMQEGTDSATLLKAGRAEIEALQALVARSVEPKKIPAAACSGDTAAQEVLVSSVPNYNFTYV